MGSAITLETGQTPTFVLYAAKDPVGANLDRVQIVKGWIDQDGASHEKIYDVLLSDAGRRTDNGIEPVGDSVDVAKASYTNTIGAETLSGVWTDPDFDQTETAFYYMRVLEIPTPRWTTYALAQHPEASIPDDVPRSQQDRAYTSPIWVQVREDN